MFPGWHTASWDSFLFHWWNNLVRSKPISLILDMNSGVQASVVAIHQTKLQILPWEYQNLQNELLALQSKVMIYIT